MLRGLAEERLEKIKKKRPKGGTPGTPGTPGGLSGGGSNLSLPPSLTSSGNYSFDGGEVVGCTVGGMVGGSLNVVAALAASSSALEPVALKTPSSTDLVALSSTSSVCESDGESLSRVPSTGYFVEGLDFSDSPFSNEIGKGLKRYEGTTEFSPYEFQVAGHVALLKSNPEGRIFKPFQVQELGFYSVVPDTCPALLPFIPEFWGYVDVSQSELKKLFDGCLVNTPIGVSPVTDNDSTNDWSPWSVQMHRARLMEINEFNEPSFPYLVIEDLTCRYSRPSVLDLKMGVKQFGDLSSEEKKRSKISKSLSSTSSTVGFRISGMQLWDPSLKKYAHLHKYDGRSLTDETLEQSLRGFFYNKQSEYRKDLIEVVVKKMKELLQIVSTSAFRFYCTSLLLLYEGDMNYSTPDKVDIRMIDFAHAYPKGDKDDDSGYAFGLKSIIAMLENTLKL